MTTRLKFIALIAAVAFSTWMFDFPVHRLVVGLAALLIAATIFGPKIIWLLGVKFPEQRKAGQALAKHKKNHPESYR